MATGEGAAMCPGIGPTAKLIGSERRVLPACLLLELWVLLDAVLLTDQGPCCVLLALLRVPC